MERLKYDWFDNLGSNQVDCSKISKIRKIPNICKIVAVGQLFYFIKSHFKFFNDSMFVCKYLHRVLDSENCLGNSLILSWRDDSRQDLAEIRDFWCLEFSKTTRGWCESDCIINLNLQRFIKSIKFASNRCIYKACTLKFLKDEDRSAKVDGQKGR